MRLIKKIIILLVALSTMIFANTVGTITALSGSASILRDGTNIKATLGAKLNEKDRITTKEKSKVQVIFNDETIITIGKNSDFSIKKYFYEDSKTPVAKFGLLKGAMRTITGKIGKIAPDRFSVKTKTATIGIRGTNFSILAGPDGSTRVYCTFGAISVLSKGVSSIVNQGFYIQVSPKGKRSAPIKFTPKDLKKMRADSFTGGKGVAGKLKGAKLTGKMDADSLVDGTIGGIKVTNMGDLEKLVADEKILAKIIKATSISDFAFFGFGTAWGSSSVTALATKISNNGASFDGAYIKEVTTDPFTFNYVISSTPTIITSSDTFETTFSNVLDASGNPYTDLLISSSSFKTTNDDLDPDDDMLWGEWSVAFSFKNAGTPTSHTGSGLWVGGVNTTAAAIQSYNQNGIIYNGKYKGQLTAGNVAITGTAQLTVNFGADTASLVINNYSTGNAWSTYSIPSGVSSGSLSGTGSLGGGTTSGHLVGAIGNSAAGEFTIKESGTMIAEGVYQVHTAATNFVIQGAQ